MANQKEPYIKRDPGDLISAEDWNEVQHLIRDDINMQLDRVKQEIIGGKVKEAENAEKFADSNRHDWLGFLDERYSPRGHGHEGRSVYRRFIKRFSNVTDDKILKVLLEHNLGRFPLVDIYELKNVTDVAADEAKGIIDLTSYNILLYYGHEDSDKYKLYSKVYKDRVPMGYPLEQLLDELQVEYEDDDTLRDVINDLWTAFLKDPNDEIEHTETPWIKKCFEKRCTVAHLKKADEWPDIYVAIKPIKPSASIATVTHVNYNTLNIEITDWQATGDNLDLMFILRI